MLCLRSTAIYITTVRRRPACRVATGEEPERSNEWIEQRGMNGADRYTDGVTARCAVHACPEVCGGTLQLCGLLRGGGAKLEKQVSVPGGRIAPDLHKWGAPLHQSVEARERWLFELKAPPQGPIPPIEPLYAAARNARGNLNTQHSCRSRHHTL